MDWLRCCLDGLGVALQGLHIPRQAFIFTMKRALWIRVIDLDTMIDMTICASCKLTFKNEKTQQSYLNMLQTLKDTSVSN